MRNAGKHLADKTHTSKIIQIKFTKKKNYYHPASYNKFHTLCVLYRMSLGFLFCIFMYLQANALTSTP